MLKRNFDHYMAMVILRNITFQSFCFIHCRPNQQLDMLVMLLVDITNAGRKLSAQAGHLV